MNNWIGQVDFSLIALILKGNVFRTDLTKLKGLYPEGFSDVSKT